MDAEPGSYRLGIFGWLASEELQINGNFGLKDQACAFKWVSWNEILCVYKF